VPPDSIYGCWGDQHNKFYGGEYTARCSSTFTRPSRLPTAGPGDAGRAAGELRPHAPDPGMDCKPAMFLEGILNSAAEPTSISSASTLSLSIWKARLPRTWGTAAARRVVLGKISFLREVMARYGVNKPLILSESSLLCPEGQVGCDPASEAFKDAQATYVGMLYTPHLGSQSPGHRMVYPGGSGLAQTLG